MHLSRELRWRDNFHLLSRVHTQRLFRVLHCTTIAASHSGTTTLEVGTQLFSSQQSSISCLFELPYVVQLASSLANMFSMMQYAWCKSCCRNIISSSITIEHNLAQVRHIKLETWYAESFISCTIPSFTRYPNQRAGCEAGSYGKFSRSREIRSKYNSRSGKSEISVHRVIQFPRAGVVNGVSMLGRTYSKPYL